MRERRGKGEKGAVFRALRHPIRVFALTLAALSLTSAVAGGAGIIASMLGVALGVVAGELLGRSRYRLPVVVAAHGVLLLLLWLIAWASRWRRFYRATRSRTSPAD